MDTTSDTLFGKVTKAEVCSMYEIVYPGRVYTNEYSHTRKNDKESYRKTELFQYIDAIEPGIEPRVVPVNRELLGGVEIDQVVNTVVR